MNDSTDGECRLTPDRCMVLECADKNETLNKLIDSLVAFSGSEDRNILAEAVFVREKLQSTGFGLGIAIPHVRLATATADLTAAAALIRNGVPDYSSVDSRLVHLVVMVVARADRHELYLRVLSKLSTSLKDEAFRNQVFNATSGEELYRLLSEKLN